MTRQVVIFAAGSRGDVQPCVALGRGLADRGDTVRLVASARYERLVTEAGLELAPMSVDPTEILETDEGQEWLAGGRNPVRFITSFKKVVGPMADRLLAEILDASKGADLILGPTLGLLGHQLAERAGVPSVLIHFQPSRPTGAFPHPLVPWSLGRAGNRLSYHAVDQIAWQLLRPFLNPWRRDVLGLPKLPLRGPMRGARNDPVLCCFSPSVVPRPADWPPHVHQTGYWLLPGEECEGSETLGRFIGSGPPPVYVGFGSMRTEDPAETGRIVRAALRAAGVRGVLAEPLGEACRDMHVVGDVPHSWLFPRMAAVVHHGGAGTTGAGLRAGVPTVVCPFFGDQPFWGERVAALGAGPRPVPVKELTVDRLAGAIRAAVESPAIRERAADLGARISAEDGVARACEVLARR